MPRTLSLRVGLSLILGSFVLALCVTAARAETGPRLFRVAGLPEGQQQYWCAQHGPGGWIAGTSEGIVVQDGNSWKAVRPPTSGYVRIIAHYRDGLVVAGEGFLYLYSKGKWIEKKADDLFLSAASTGDTAVLAGPRSACVVTPDGELVTLRKFPGDYNIALHRVGNRVYILPAKGRPLVWDGTRVYDAGDEFSWANREDAALMEVVSLQPLGSQDFFAATNRGLFFIHGKNLEPALPLVRKELISEGIISAYLLGRTITVLTFSGGVRVFAKDTGNLLWRATAAEYGGIYFSQLLDDGLLIGTSTGLFVLPDPGRYRYTSLPVGDFLFTGNSIDGPVVGLTTGPVALDGTKVEAPSRITSSAVLRDGRQVWSSVGKLTIGGRDFLVPGPDILGVAEGRDGEIVVLQLNGLGFWNLAALSRASHSTAITGATPNSLASTSRGGYLVGTSDGVLSFGPDGSPIGRWGEKMMRVKSFASGAVAMDALGNVFSEDGRKQISVPGGEVLDLTEWSGATWLLVHFADDSTWVGRWDAVAARWKPYDVPLARKAHAIIGEKETLFVICSDSILELQDPRPFALPRMELAVGADAVLPTRVSAHLSRDVSSLKLLFPPARLGPWSNPSYQVQIDDGGWDNIGSPSSTRLTRLAFGTSVVNVSRSYAGIEDRTTFKLERDWPWWARWPAVLLYLGSVAALVFVTISWRTRLLRKRAEMLERQVEERTAELKKAQKAREDFFSTISHEIRNPLNGVVGICDILGHLDDSDPRRTRRHVKTLRGCADQLRTILDDVLDFSRIDRGEIQIYDEVFELTAAIDGAARSVDPGLEKVTVKVPVREFWVHGDQGKIRQIITNLASNALKYGVPPGSQVIAEAEEQPGGPVRLTVCVRNTGITLTAEEIDKIFSEFVRGQDALRRRIPGSGLGLAVSRRMAEAMKGMLTATSVNGLTEFKLTISLERGEPVEENASEITAPFEPSRALAIEDEEYNRTVLGFHLAQLGYQVDWAKDGASALQWVRESGYDLILTDFMLPDTTGDELARKLLEMLPDPKPPIIAVTAYSTPEKIAQAKAAGISAFVTKPVSRKKLRAAILAATANFEVRASIKQDPAIKCDFSVFERLDEGRRLLAEYAEGLMSDWEAIARECVGNLGQRPMLHAVHTFKSRVLVAHAAEIAEQLGLLEDAVLESREADVLRLLAVVRPMIAELSARAKEAAFG